MTHNKSKEPIQPDAYAELLESVSLENIFLINSTFEVDRNKLLAVQHNDESEDSDLNNDVTFEVEYNRAGNYHELTVEFCSKLQTNAEPEPLLNFSASYTLVLFSKLDLPSEFFEVYNRVSLPINVWPYFRELFQNFSGRAGIPPITLPLIKSGYKQLSQKSPGNDVDK